MSEYFPKPKSFGRKVEDELNLSNYLTKADLKYATGFDASKFSKKVDLASSKFEVDKLDIKKSEKVTTGLSSLKSKGDKLDVDKFVLAPVDLSILSDVVKNDVAKKDVYNAKIKNIESEIPDFTNIATNTTLNSKIH